MPNPGDEIQGKQPTAPDANGGQLHDAQDDARDARMASNISSTFSGNRIGDGIAEKRMNLLDALHDAEPQVGRRPTPVHDPWPKRKMYIKGIALGLLVCIVVVVLIFILASQGNAGSQLL